MKQKYSVFIDIPNRCFNLLLKNKGKSRGFGKVGLKITGSAKLKS